MKIKEEKTSKENSAPKAQTTSVETPRITPPPPLKKIQAEDRSHKGEEKGEQGKPAQPPKAMKVSELQRMNIEGLQKYAKELGIKHVGAQTKSQLVFEIVKLKSTRSNELLFAEGVLEVLPDGFRRNYSIFSQFKNCWSIYARFHIYEIPYMRDSIYTKFHICEIPYMQDNIVV